MLLKLTWYVFIIEYGYLSTSKEEEICVSHSGASRVLVVQVLVPVGDISPAKFDHYATLVMQYRQVCLRVDM